MPSLREILSALFLPFRALRNQQQSSTPTSSSSLLPRGVELLQEAIDILRSGQDSRYASEALQIATPSGEPWAHSAVAQPHSSRWVGQPEDLAAWLKQFCEEPAPAQTCHEPSCERKFGEHLFLNDWRLSFLGNASDDQSSSIFRKFFDKTRIILSASASALLRWTGIGKLLTLAATQRVLCWRCGSHFCQLHAYRPATLILHQRDAGNVRDTLEALWRESAEVSFDMALGTDHCGRARLPSANGSLTGHLPPREESIKHRNCKLSLLGFVKRFCSHTRSHAQTSTDLENGLYYEVSPGTFYSFEPIEDHTVFPSYTAASSAPSVASSDLDLDFSCRSTPISTPATSAGQKALNVMGVPTFLLRDGRRMLILPDGRILVRERVCDHCHRTVFAARGNELSRRNREMEKQKMRRWEGKQRQKKANETGRHQGSQVCQNKVVNVTDEQILQALQAAVDVTTTTTPSNSSSASSSRHSRRSHPHGAYERAPRPPLSYEQQLLHPRVPHVAQLGTPSRSHPGPHSYNSLDVKCFGRDYHTSGTSGASDPVNHTHEPTPPAASRRGDGAGPARGRVQLWSAGSRSPLRLAYV
ncbi:hypothetical protein BCV69DRAFT_301905 [Microstroma glucosiphilum]|uniref:Uncharacterized protein n=1 Tax=Pseudomicrostroma glucosiphilum TaxID=1684307 RepID=A0A316TZN8_9BASI|nr:hypothetical protein BCV69DRAFT_301905 [Pseudomicrostroma glucosiphilum]PWN17723.1 hypothetical protein BCV69DRAFT_301905 [Pseudomicrostroma glucosiphilum]